MVKKSIFTLFLLLFILGALYSENDELIIGKFFVGFEIGPETCLSILLPKLSFYLYDPWLNCFYFGVDVSLFVFIVTWSSYSITAGFQYSFITIDNSISYLSEPYNKKSHITYNPKIGIQFFNILFRIGPSFIIYKSHENILNLLDLYFSEDIGLNIELSFFWKI